MKTEGPAITALGSLFRLTQIFLWDDASAEVPEGSSFAQRLDTPANNEEEDNSSITSAFNDYNPSLEDARLAEEMNALGLPISFHTNKHKRNGMVKGKRSKLMKYPHHDKQIGDGVLECPKVSEGDIVSHTVFPDETSTSLCCMSMLGKSELPCCDVAVDVNIPQSSTGEADDTVSLNAWTSNGATKKIIYDENSNLMPNSSLDCDFVKNDSVLKDGMETAAYTRNMSFENSSASCLIDAEIDCGKKEVDGRFVECEHLDGSLVAYHGTQSENTCNDISIEQLGVPKLFSPSQSSEVMDLDGIDSSESYGDLGDWRVYWDSFYMRNYYYNIKTNESTWYRPPGMEFSLGNITNELSEIIPGQDNTKTVEACDLQNMFGVHNPGDEVSGQPLNMHSLEIELDAGKSMCGMTVSDLSSCSIHEINRNHNDKINSCIFSESDTLKYIGSLEEKLEQLDYDEVGSSDLQLMLTNGTDEMDYSKPKDETKMSVACERTCENLTSAPAEAVFESGHCDMHPGYIVSTMDECNVAYNSVTTKWKKKVRRRRTLPWKKISNENEGFEFQGLPGDYSADISKYWCQRYLLFSKYDDGIQMDEEGWFSVTPETIAQHHASRCGNGIIIDCFTGVGGNAIQFAQRSKHVIAIDIDPKKIEYAQHNATIYGVNDRIDFINGDSFLLAPAMKQADTVFLSPPWGGPDYVKVEKYDIKTMLKPHDGFFLFNIVKKVAPRVVMFLPRNVDINQLAELSLSADPPWSLEVEMNFLNGKFKAVTAYFTNTSMQKNISSSQ